MRSPLTQPLPLAGERSLKGMERVMSASATIRAHATDAAQRVRAEATSGFL